MEETPPQPRSEHERLVIDTIEEIAGVYAGDMVRAFYDDKLTTITQDDIGPFAAKHGYVEEHVFFVLELLVSGRLWNRVVLNESKNQRLMMSRLTKRLASANAKDWKRLVSSVHLGWSGE